MALFQFLGQIGIPCDIPGIVSARAIHHTSHGERIHLRSHGKRRYIHLGNTLCLVESLPNGFWKIFLRCKTFLVRGDKVFFLAISKQSYNLPLQCMSYTGRDGCLRLRYSGVFLPHLVRPAVSLDFFEPHFMRFPSYLC